MGVIVDTSIWVDVERKRLTHTQVAAAVNNEPVYLVPPVVAELEYGVCRAKTEAQKNRRISALAKIKKKPCLTMDKETGELFGRIAEYLDRKGMSASCKVQDLWIAAIALQHNMKVLTHNTKDFREIPGLVVIEI